MSLQLTSSTSPMMDYERKDTSNNGRIRIDNDDDLFLNKTVVCHSLMQNKARNNFQVQIHNSKYTRPLRYLYEYNIYTKVNEISIFFFKYIGYVASSALEKRL